MRYTLPLLAILLATTLTANAEVDTLIGKSAPFSSDYKQLTARVCENASTDEAKANAIYNWITTHIALDIKAIKNPDREKATVKDVLSKRKTTSEGYSLLFVEMCKAAGLAAVPVEGYVKDWIFDNGDQFCIPNLDWCAVMINGKWEFADPTFGAGGVQHYTGWFKKQLDKLSKPKLRYGKKERFVFRYNPEYFMPDVMQFRLTHLPIDPIWQLTSTPMPLQVFEMGDSAVYAFNKAHHDVNQHNSSLVAISAMNEYERALDYADRVYDFNRRFPSVLALKENIEAANKIEKDNETGQTRSTVEATKLKLKKSQDYLKEQKQAFPEHFSVLDKKNTTKNKEGLEHIRTIKTGNKLTSGKYTRYKQTCVRKATACRTKEAAVDKRKDGIISIFKVAGIQKTEYDPEMLRLQDSIESRNAHIQELKANLATLPDSIMLIQRFTNSTAEQLTAACETNWSFVTDEASYRVRMKDNYDDEVKDLSGKYTQTKTEELDLLEAQLFAGYDSATAAQERLYAASIALLDVYKNNLKDIATYKSKYKKGNALTNGYTQQKEEAMAFANTYLKNLAIYQEYHLDSKNMFAAFEKAYKATDKVTENMQIAEKQRFKEEGKSIKEKKSYDERDNQRLQKNINTTIRKIDAALQKTVRS